MHYSNGDAKKTLCASCLSLLRASRLPFLEAVDAWDGGSTLRKPGWTAIFVKSLAGVRLSISAASGKDVQSLHQRCMESRFVQQAFSER